MYISKSMIIVICLLFVWTMAGLNRWATWKNNEMIQAQIETINPQSKLKIISFVYNGKTYRDILINDITDETQAYQEKVIEQYDANSHNMQKNNIKIIVKHHNPKNYTILNFTDFWLPAIIVAIFFSLVVLLYFQVFYSKTKKFKLLFRTYPFTQKHSV